jgi:hypothetical protein
MLIYVFIIMLVSWLVSLLWCSTTLLVIIYIKYFELEILGLGWREGAKKGQGGHLCYMIDFSMESWNGKIYKWVFEY